MTAPQEMVLSMGAHFFGLMPHLWSVRVFKVVVENVGANSTCNRPLVGELIGLDGPERAELDDAEFEEISATAPSSTVGLTVSAEESVETLEHIQAWNRYCPMLREVQLKPGYVWRRADRNDTWTQRATKVSRVRNAGFEEV
ncbi:hypothetical protein JVU11DRAFT_8202 [Chiua virens]|nr:hypothetical protein JVU11DRAFT_8202 [Chiua virens]